VQFLVRAFFVLVYLLLIITMLATTFASASLSTPLFRKRVCSSPSTNRFRNLIEAC
jgi:hypothetical protein